MGPTVLNVAQNGGDVTKIDAFDITTGTLSPASNLRGTFGMAAIISVVDVNPFSAENKHLSYLGNGKNIIQVGFDFSMSTFGESAKFTYGTLGGGNGTVGMFTDVVTVNLGANYKVINCGGIKSSVFILRFPFLA